MLLLILEYVIKIAKVNFKACSLCNILFAIVSVKYKI